MNAATVAHRWANKDFGRDNTLTASRSCHSEGRTYYSYSTVFGQWVDRARNLLNSALEDDDYLFIGRGYDDDVCFWFIGTRASILAHLNEIITEKEEEQ